MESIITVENLSFAYHLFPILQNVTFQVSRGEFVGIIGPNGGGKTTLLKLIMGFLKPSSGKISVFEASPQLAQKGIGYVPQNLRFDKQFPISALELVLSGCLSQLPWYGLYSRKDKRAALDTLEQVGLLDFRNVPFGSLSGGQMQRALIARALVSKPSLLILDEPTANVDTQAEIDIFNILKGLHKTITMLMVTHDLRTAIDQVDRILCVQRELVALTPEEVCKHYAIGLYHPPLLQSSQNTDEL